MSIVTGDVARHTSNAPENMQGFRRQGTESGRWCPGQSRPISQRTGQGFVGCVVTGNLSGAR